MVPSAEQIIAAVCFRYELAPDEMRRGRGVECVEARAVTLALVCRLRGTSLSGAGRAIGVPHCRSSYMRDLGVEALRETPVGRAVAEDFGI